MLKRRLAIARALLIVLFLSAAASAGTDTLATNARKLIVIDAPSNLGLRPPRPGAVPGVRRMAEVLRQHGLLQRLKAQDGGRIAPPAYSPEPEMTTGFRNGKGIQTFSATLATHTKEVVRSGQFPVVLGGDCSILLGNMLALKSLGHYGLVFIDGHDDFSPTRNPDKYRGILTAAGRDLGLVTGHGPTALTDMQGAKPYVREEDAVLFGMYRDPADTQDFDIDKLEASQIHQFRIERIRKSGLRASAQEAVRLLESKNLDGFWIHVDTDVLDQSVMPAVDSPNPNGFRYEELADVLRVFLASPKAVGIEFTIYDPDLDPSGTYAERLVDMIADAFSPAATSSNRSVPTIKELVSSGPSPEHRDKLMMYGQFVGDWEFENTNYLPDGTVRHTTGEWHFGWILDGRVIEDVWIVPTRREQKESGTGPIGFGITVRSYDPKADLWNITWHGALTGTVMHFKARQQGEEIIQELRNRDGTLTRWNFSKITPRSFHWRSVSSSDEGKTWRLEQEMNVHRIGAENEAPAADKN